LGRITRSLTQGASATAPPGHGASSVTDLYERHQVAAFLAEDAERLRGVLGEVVATALRVVK
jgi:hypothetical protein